MERLGVSEDELSQTEDFEKLGKYGADKDVELTNLGARDYIGERNAEIKKAQFNTFTSGLLLALAATGTVIDFNPKDIEKVKNIIDDFGKNFNKLIDSRVESIKKISPLDALILKSIKKPFEYVDEKVKEFFEQGIEKTAIKIIGKAGEVVVPFIHLLQNY